VEDGLRRCGKIVDDLQRVRCYDAIAAQFLAGRASGDLVLIDQSQAKQVRRSMFGFSIPNVGIFSGRKGEDTEEIEGKVVTSRHIGDGRYRLKLEDGAVWVTTERSKIGAEPKPSSTVRIRKASLGSYFMNVDGARAVRSNRME
jgi:hypothetical protein